jgi:hypothetical protein
MWWCPTHIPLCFRFVFLRLVCPVLPVSLNCPFCIAPSVFSNVYFSPLNIMSWSLQLQQANEKMRKIWRKSKLKSEKIWEIQKKRKLNSEIIWKIWNKNKLNSDKIWKVGKKRQLNSGKIWKIWETSNNESYTFHL